jgi:hypothetical protein
MASGVITATDPPAALVGKSRKRNWWNASQSRWDGLMPSTAGTRDWFVMKDILSAQTFTTAELAVRDSDRPSIWWDGDNDVVHCISGRNTGSTVRYSASAYTSGTDTYAAASPATETIPGITADDTQINSIIVSPNGKIWVFSCDASAGMEVQIRTSGSWETSPIVIDAGPTVDGCSAAVLFVDDGTTYVGCLVYEDSSVDAEQHFYWIAEDDADPTIAGHWTDDTASMPAFDGSDVADAHCDVTVGEDETVWGIYKSSADEVKLVERALSGGDDGTGTWVSSTVEAWAAADNVSRPCIALKKIDASASVELIVFVHEDTADDILYKTSPLDTPSFSSASAIIDEATDTFSNPTCVQSGFIYDSDSGVAMVALNVTDDDMWYGSLTITAPAGGGNDGAAMYHHLQNMGVYG